MIIIKIFFQTQLPYLGLLISTTSLPLFLFYQFSSYSAPKIQYVFIFALIIYHFLIFNESKFRKGQEPDIIHKLKKERGQHPSRQEIVQRYGVLLKCRGMSMVLTLLSLFGVMIYFQEF